jgi:thiamine-phosphate pyrophosphorylase
VIVNDRVDIALASGAGGVHVGQEDLPLDQVIRLAGGRLKIGVSTHDLHQARQAQAGGADYIGCGPTFPSNTKGFKQYAGVEFLAEVAKEIELPAYAIGGIDAGNVSQVIQAGFRRVAVGGAIWNQVGGAQVAADLRSKLEG